ncbi:MAG TPA: AMP-binding protein [Nevskiaceae bacterium]|nr:AMP-binding protein [Nevskiaceae bacterium]
MRPRTITQSQPRPPEVADATLADLYQRNLEATPHGIACRSYRAREEAWIDTSWSELAASARRFAAGLRASGLEPGDRVAIQLGGGPEWLALDWACGSLGLVTVGLFADDTGAGAARQLADSGARLVFTRDAAAWDAIRASDPLPSVETVVLVRGGLAGDTRSLALTHWLPAAQALLAVDARPDALATIVYTSGATGQPKGVMLSHRGLVANARASHAAVPIGTDDVVLSVLPLAHLYARSVGVYASLAAGATIVFARGGGHLAEDLAVHRPTVLVGVPRLYERLHAAVEMELDHGSLTRRALFRLAVEAGWAAQRRRGAAPLFTGGLIRRAGQSLRARLGGRLRVAICGGAALSPHISRMFVALGIPLLQGYGLTEAGPVVSVNRIGDNDPASCGVPLDGVETRVEASGELLVRAPGVMLGYWNDADATRAVLDGAGWLRTGDKVSRLEAHRLYLTGRIKDILVTATGEKASAADIESRLRELPIVEQVMVVGEAKPFLAALIVPQPGPLALLRAEIGLTDGDDSDAAREALEAVILERCREVLRDAPRNHYVLRVGLVCQPWTTHNGMITATGKLRRCEVLRANAAAVDRLYAGHFVAPATDCSDNATV